MADLSRCHSIADLQKAARRALPRVMFDYLEGGAEDEITMARNCAVFSDYQWIPRVLRDVSQIDLSTQFLGQSSSMPLICAPTGMSRMFHYQGETAVAKAADSAGIPYTLSTVATRSIEEIARIGLTPKYFQIYAWKNRALVDQFIQRCRESGYQGMMLAVDLAALGKRERDLHNGHGRPVELRLKTALGALRRPRWLFRFLTSEPMLMANMAEQLPHGGNALKTLDTVNEQFDASVTWDDAKRIQEQWGSLFVLKGIQSVQDAILAARMGVSGIVLSNHGGRQLDGTSTALELLPQVREAVGDGIEIFIDGGIRRGADVLKAVALGANACLIGRPYLYGLAAGGQAGVARSLELLRTEMEQTMKLIGCASISELDQSYLCKLP